MEWEGYNGIFIRDHESAKVIKHIKGGIRKALVAYLRKLKANQTKKQEIEEQYQIQELKIKKAFRLYFSFDSRNLKEN